MNHGPKILTYLAEGNKFSQVLLVAGAPPVEKVDARFHIVLNVVLTPDDIRETLSFFAGHARRSGPTDLGHNGVFAFGLPNLGRFKIHYFTQRGSVFLSIQRMAHDIPKIGDLLSQPGQVSVMDAALTQPDGGLVIFAGPSMDLLSRLLYAALDRINQSKYSLIYILEQNLSFLLRHRNSVIVQVDIGTDVNSLAEGIENCLLLAPDVVYVRDPKTPEDFSSLMCMAEAGSLVLISLIAYNEQQMQCDLKHRIPDICQSLNRILRKTIMVTPEHHNKILLKEVSGMCPST